MNFRALASLALAFALAHAHPAPLRAAGLCPGFYRDLDPVPFTLTQLKGQALVDETYRLLKSLADAKVPGVKVRVIGYSDGLPIHEVRIIGPRGTPRAFISAGVHGSEGESVTTAMRFVEWAAETPSARGQYDLTIVPMVNPGGVSRETRMSLAGKDLNRSFREGEWTEASNVIREAYGKQRFDVAIDLHGAEKKKHFFLISASAEDTRSPRILSSVPEDLLLPSGSGTYPDWAPGYNNPRAYLLQAPGVASSQNPGTLKDYMASLGTPYSYTLEYPGAIDFKQQQDWNYRILQTILTTTRQDMLNDAKRNLR